MRDYGMKYAIYIRRDCVILNYLWNLFVGCFYRISFKHTFKENCFEVNYLKNEWKLCQLSFIIKIASNLEQTTST